MNGDGEPRDPGTRRPLCTPWVAQAGGDRVQLIRGLTLFLGRPYICGPAVTCACAPDDNLALHLALYRAAPGSVIVCHADEPGRTGLFGELMATDALRRGLGGLVVDGTVRDLDDLDRLGFPVLCRGAAPAQSAKRRVGSVDRPVTVGGVVVGPGAQIVADRDGALVVDRDLWPSVRDDALALAGHEDVVLRRISQGERLAEILGLAGPGTGSEGAPSHP